MSYLTTSDAPNFGATASVTQPMLDQAAAVINTYCGRPAGLLIEANSDGTPVCMAYASPKFSMTLAAPMSAGTSVSFALPAWARVFPGDALVIDRGLTTAEAVAVTAVSNGVATLAVVRFSHAAGATVLMGLTLLEEKRIPTKGILPLRLSPVVSILALTIEAVPVTSAISWVDANRLQIPGSPGQMAKVAYLAGFQTAPDALKLATAMVANQIAENAIMGSTLYKSEEYGGRKYERFDSQGLIDTRIAQILTPFRAVT